MVKLTINDQEVFVKKGTTILQAALKLNIEIPRFCYYENLSIAGNCRMCLVEVEKSPKPIASCAMPVTEGMVVRTNSLSIQKAREGVLEFLLVNHPLDCPICDQGGECDLQDETLAFGNDKGRYFDKKRAVEDVNLGPFVKTVMTRCIHCTRCVRFTTEVAGLPEMGTLGRGGQTEIGTYIEQIISSELSGNIIDLCPVGALTSKPYTFTARPWELKSVESVDIFDGLGTNIRIDTRGSRVLRVLPRVNDITTSEWISDKVRFFYDGLERQRLYNPMALNSEGVFVNVTWEEAFFQISQKIKELKENSSVSAIIGSYTEVEAIVAMQDLIANIGKGFVYSEEGTSNNDFKQNYTINFKLEELQDADACFIVGSNLKIDSPVLNAVIRQAVVHKGLPVFTIGPCSDFTYETMHLGSNLEVFKNICEGRHPASKYLLGKKVIVLFSHLYQDYLGYLQNAKKEASNLTGNTILTGVLHLTGGTAGLSELGVSKYTTNVNGIHFLLDTNNVKVNSDFVVYLGHHGGKNTSLANIILPGTTFTETSGFFINTFGVSQEVQKATNSPGASKDNWIVIKALSDYLGQNLAYENLATLRSVVETKIPSLNEKIQMETLTVPEQKHSVIANTETTIAINSVNDYYRSDSLTDSSLNMCNMSKLRNSQVI